MELYHFAKGNRARKEDSPMTVKRDMNNMSKWVVFCALLGNIVFFQSLGFADTGSQSAQVKADDNTVLLLHMDEAGWAGTEKEVIDSSGQENHATASGGATTIADGKFSRAGSFDGIDDYIIIPNINLGKMSKGTISFWAKPKKQTTDFARIISLETAAGKGLTILQREVGEDRIYVDFGECSIPASDDNFPENQWTHVVFIWYDGDGCYLYLNGKLVGRDTIYNMNPSQWSSDLTIGARFRGTRFSGYIDEFYISNKILSLDEIKSSSYLGKEEYL